ncbi:MAG TPA: ABC transporter ATP-binding protein [bacterium (Candidatus Stahlbacteria)]|nr:ABC transporter ATP-binding protein [Candidatus Stahlbacteria bacterium]
MKNDSAVLSLKDISAGYYERKVLLGVNLEIKENEIVLLIGPNGAGESTLLKVIAGILRPWAGEVFFKGTRLDGLSPAQRAKLGISYFLQGGEVFPNLTVEENLMTAGLFIKREIFIRREEHLFRLFPKLADLKCRRAGLLSGGERHQLALGMIFVRHPSLMLLDEPSAGLSPFLVEELMEKIGSMMREMQSSILMVEQNVKEGLKIADRVYLMKAGEIVKGSSTEEIKGQKVLEQIFFS